LAATGLLEKMTADEPALARASDQCAMAWRRARIALLDLQSVLAKTVDEPHSAETIDVYALESVSALYALLEAESRRHSGVASADVVFDVVLVSVAS
jgi:hypothetical protein